MKIEKIGQIALTVSNLKAARDFYGKTLGLAFLFEAPPSMAFYDIGGTRLLLGEGEKVTPGGPILYFSTTDIETAYKNLEKAGTECLRAPTLTHKTDQSELWIAFFKDPDGHTLALMEERAL